MLAESGLRAAGRWWSGGAPPATRSSVRSTAAWLVYLGSSSTSATATSCGRRATPWSIERGTRGLAWTTSRHRRCGCARRVPGGLVGVGHGTLAASPLTPSPTHYPIAVGPHKAVQGTADVQIVSRAPIRATRPGQRPVALGSEPRTLRRGGRRCAAASRSSPMAGPTMPVVTRSPIQGGGAACGESESCRPYFSPWDPRGTSGGRARQRRCGAGRMSGDRVATGSPTRARPSRAARDST